MANPSTRMRAAGTSRAVRRRTSWRPSLSHFLIGLAAVLAFTFNLIAIQQRSSTTLVAVADRPIAAGSAIAIDDLRFVPVSSDFAALDSLLDEVAAGSVEGWIADRAIAEGAIVERSSFVQPAASSGLRSMSIPIATQHAAGGSIGPGDRIDVISVVDGQATYIVSEIEVLTVADGSGDAFASISDYFVVVAVDADQALAIAEALDNASLELIRSTGARAIVEKGR